MNRVPWFSAILILAGVLVAGGLSASAAERSRATAAEDVSLPLALQWKFSSVELGGEPPARNPSSPVVSGDTVYICARGLTADKTPTTSVYALAIETGEKKWDHILEGSVFGTLALENDVLWVADTKGWLYALDTKRSGEELTRFKLEAGSRATPVIHEGVLYLGDDSGMFYAIDTTTRQERWRFRAGGPVKLPVAVSVETNLVYIATSEPMLHALRISDGRESWRHPMPEVMMDGAPLLWENNLYVPSGKHLFCVTASRGRDRWNSSQLASTTGHPIVETPTVVEEGDGARIYFACQDGTLNCIDANTGRMAWKRPALLDRVPTGSPVVTRNAVLVGAQGGFLYAIDRENGSKLLWKYRVFPPKDIAQQGQPVSINGTPIVADGRVLALSNEGTLYCFSPDAVDRTPPEAKEFHVHDTPVEKDTDPVYGVPPVPFKVTIEDEGSGIDESKLVFKLDGVAVKHEFNAATGELTYSTPVTQPAKPLADGQHKVSVVVADWRGNTKEYEWSFKVDHRWVPVPKLPAGAAPGAGRMGGGMGGMGGMGGGVRR